MPKIIEDVEENIFKSAMELFSLKGYQDTEMKMIAEKAGLAVGTLYNYYRSKNGLFMYILESEWQETCNKLENINCSSMPWDEKLKETLYVLYEDMEDRKCLGFELLRANMINSKNKEKLLLLKDVLLSNIRRIFIDSSFGHKQHLTPEIIERLIDMVVTTTHRLIVLFPSEKEKNLEYLYCIIKKIAA
ncbi:MAG: helix-turn-helix domain containing protein [Clostridia bacterium]|nr:helix-turn-helix domain containing protein [Clostridia bacterium]